MLFSSLIMRPWLLQCKKIDESVKPKLLADDMLVVAHGQDRVEHFIAALDSTHEYIDMMGGS